MLLTFPSGFKSWQWPVLWLPLAQCDLPVLTCVILQRKAHVCLLGWSDPELYFQRNVPVGENMAWKYSMSLGRHLPAMVSFLILGYFLFYSGGSDIDSHCPSKKCCPTWPSFLLMLPSHISVTAVPSWSSWVTPLSSFSTFCVQLDTSAQLSPLLLMSLQLSQCCLWSWADLPSPAQSVSQNSLGLERGSSPGQQFPCSTCTLVLGPFWAFASQVSCCYSPVLCSAQAWAIHRAQSCPEPPPTDFWAHSFSCALTNPLSHRACSELSTEFAFALSSISFTHLLASLLFHLRTQLLSSPCLSVSPTALICATSVWELSDQHSCAFPSVAPFGMQQTPFNFQQRHCLLLPRVIYGAHTKCAMVGGLECCNHWLSCSSAQVVSWLHAGSQPVGVHVLLGLDRACPDVILPEVVQVENYLIRVSWYLPV